MRAPEGVPAETTPLQAPLFRPGQLFTSSKPIRIPFDRIGPVACMQIAARPTRAGLIRY